MIIKTQITMPRRVAAAVLTLLLAFHFVCVPSLTAFAEGDDVQAIGIGGNTASPNPFFHGRIVDITFRHDYENNDNYALFKSSDGQEERVVLSNNTDKTVPLNGSMEKFGVKVTWNGQEFGTLNMVSTIDSGYLRMDSYENAEETFMDLTFESTDSQYKVRYWETDRSASHTLKDESNKVHLSNARNPYNSCAMFSISHIKVVLTEDDPVRLDNAQGLVFDFPETIEYDASNPYPEPDFTLTYNGVALKKDVDYTTSWYHGNGVIGRHNAIVYGKGLGAGTIFFGKTNHFFYVVKAKPEITTKPAGKNLTWTGESQELVSPGVVNGGTLQYSLDGVNFTDRIPTAKEVGTYKVYYRVDGDERYESLDDASYVVTSIMKWPVYSVTFNTDGGSDVATARVIHNHTVDRPEDPTRKGFLFRGWVDGSGNDYDFNQPVLADTTLTAKWAATYIDETGAEKVLEPGAYSTANTYSWGTGYYVVTGNDTLSNQHVSVMGNATLILADDLTLTVKKGIEVNSPFTLTVYGQKEGTGRLVTTGGSYFTTSTVIAGIGGSYSDSTGGTFGDITINGGNVTATGGTDSIGIGGSRATVTVNGGNVTASSRGSGYGIGGQYATVNLSWTKTSNRVTSSSYCGTVKFVKPFVLASDTDTPATADNIGGETLVPVTACTVTFDSNGGSAVDSVRISHGDTVDEPAAPTREGLTFMGWYNGEELYHFSSPVTSNLTLTAHWGDVVYLDENGDTQSVSAEDITNVTATLTAWSDGRYRVSNDVTLSDRVTVTGSVTLILCDGATLTAEKGITVEGDNRLTVYAQSTDENTMGKLIANSGSNNDAGIGGTAGNACGTVTICGGNVTATGGSCGAGIGSGDEGDGGTVIIYGGNVTANGGYNGGAGIGGGYGQTSDESKGDGGTITIYGGTVTANGGDNGGGAGIGGGRCGAGGTVSIYGGTVTAIGGYLVGGAGIGSGYGGDGGTVSICGGTVTATGGREKAGIDGTVSITGGIVNATGDGAGIGGENCDITLSRTNESDRITASSYRGSVTFDGVFAPEDAPTVQAYWNSASDNNIDGKTLIPSKAFSVTFVTDGGSGVDDRLVMKNGTVTQPEDPTKEGFLFRGWLLNGKAYDFDTPVTENMELEARWTPVATYLNLEGERVTTNPADVTEITSDYFWWGQRDKETWFAVDGDVTIGRRVTVQGDVNLILRDGATLTAANGITVDATASLTVYGESTNESTMGQLIADARPMDYTSNGSRESHYTAGIGGCLGSLMGSDAGEITVNGGKVTAYGSDYGAGIGGGFGYAGSVTVNGGIVTATGGQGAAGIGGGHGDSGIVTINGGIVNATGSSYKETSSAYAEGGAGIGGGAWKDSGAITINGGVVNAVGGSLAADIGCGANAGGGTVTINGGSIVADGSTSSFGIGSGNAAIYVTLITLNWTNPTDSICCKRYSGEVIFDREHSFKLADTGEAVTSVDDIHGKTIVPGEYTAIPRCTVNFYYYSLNGKNGAFYTSATVYNGDCVTAPKEEPSMEDYTFLYWADKDGNEFDFDNILITGDINLYGCWQWSGEESAVVIRADEGCEVTVIAKEPDVGNSSNTSGYDSSNTSGGDSSNTSGYDSSNTGGDTGNSDEDTSAGGLITNGDVVERGTVLTVTVKPKPGYDLVTPEGVALTYESVYGYAYDVTVSSNPVVIKATSQKKTYTLHVQHENGAEPNVAANISDSNLHLDALPYGTQVTLTAGEANEGYEFIGWYQTNGKQLSKATEYTVAITGNQTLVAKYQATSGVVTFVSNGQTLKTIAAERIADSDFPAAPSAWYGYEFSAWDKTVADINAKLANGENVTVTAQFVPIRESFTVTVYNGESETPEEIECTQSTVITRKATQVSGKNFAYWTLDGAIFSYNSKVSYTAIASGELRAVYTADKVESVGTATIRTAKYNVGTEKLTINAYLTVPENTTIDSAGLVAASAVNYTPDNNGELTTYNADYVKLSSAAVGKCAPVNYTWNKGKVSPGDVWYVRAHLSYWDENSEYHELYGSLITVTAGCDYDYAEKGTAKIRTATYNATTKKATFNAYLTVPDNAVIVKAGLVAASFENFNPEENVLTASNADYVKSSSLAVGKCAPVNYTWNKGNVNPGDTWYVRAYLVYTLNGAEHTIYGSLTSLTA